MAGLGPCVFARPARPPLGWVSYGGTVARLRSRAQVGGFYEFPTLYIPFYPGYVCVWKPMTRNKPAQNSRYFLLASRK